METPVLNSHNKSEYEPAHSCEHLLNATMVKMFGCPRSRNAHVEKLLITICDLVFILSKWSFNTFYIVVEDLFGVIVS